MPFTPIAILGTGCVLPGALGADALWQLVRAGRSALAPAAPDHWALSPHADRKRLADEMASEVGGRVTGFERAFSPEGFRVPVDPALDPVFLWTLHAAREALREAGRDVFRAPVRGAFVLGNLSYPTPGLIRYALDVWGKKQRPPQGARDRFMSGLPAALAARAIGFEGPAFALDAACASSLYAIKLACDRLADGSVELAIAGGVNHADDLFLHLGFTALSAQSPSGRSRPFHRDADGLVPAQGAALVLLKRLADAERDGDRILGVIRGVGLSNDGRSRGLLVPSEAGQIRAMRAAYEAAGVAPDTVSLVECHATGTAVGDATEVHSLAAVFRGAADVPIGSLKSNLGHLITAAGAAGLLKVLAAMRAGERPATLHADAPLDDLGGGPLRLLGAPEPWPSEGPRRAAVSAFGFGGNNAHLIVDEWVGRTAERPSAIRPPAPAEIAVIAMEARSGAASSAARFEAALASGASVVADGEARASDFELDLTGVRFPPADLLDALPQQTWLLDAVLSLAGPIARLPRERTAVLAGMQCDAEIARSSLRWRREGVTAGRIADAPLSAPVVIGCMPNMVANRLNQQLGLEGPSFTLSAEEASGTVALEIAARALSAGEIDAAIVAAVDLSCEPVQRTAAQAALPAHRGAPADACVALVLKRAADARRDGDHVLAILGGAVENGAVLALDDRESALAPRLGHAHAASGLVYVAAAIAAGRRGIALAGAAPGDPILVRVRATGETETQILVRPGDRPVPSEPAQPARPHRQRLPAHMPPVRIPSTDAPAEIMAPPPRLPPVQTAASAEPGELRPEAPAAADPRALAASALASHHRALADMHTAFVRRQSELHTHFLRAVMAPLAGGARPTSSPPRIAPAPTFMPSHVAPAPTLTPSPVAPPQIAPPPITRPALPGPKLSRRDLEALASGPVSAVFGPLFRGQDAFRRVVRMPEPPLLLADRVLGIEGEPGSMGRGTMWTETDVTDDAWYLHDGRMPAGILIESGQADLLLISWLGVDALNRGERVYRLLGCDLTAHGPLPAPGETLHYEIHVDGHAAQGDVRLFFFHYDCYVDGKLRVTVRGGQAGFFTDEELAASAGVLFRAEDAKPTPDARLDPPVVLTEKRRFSAEDLDAFIAGRARACFGPGFERADTHTRTPTIQGGRMRLLDEVTHFDPGGGPWGRGYLRARLALSPDQWFFAGHFKDDPCMPGTLMFEGSLQAMSIYLAALGFTLARDGFRFEPVPELAYRLRCRGQATPASRELIYELFVDEIVDGPTPTLYADLLGTVDGLKAFHCRRMGLRLVHGYPMDRARMALALPEDGRPVARAADFAFDQRALLACAWGRPSEAFGPMYAPFDAGVRVPRLPGPPYHFVSRVASVSGAIGGMAKGSAVVAEYDVPPEAWYFEENGAPFMPFAVLLEVALQPCGWLASYVGCTRAAGGEVIFRNLDGTGAVEREVGRDAGTLSTSARLTSLSHMGDTILVGFEVRVSCAEGLVFACETVFGFFAPETMRDQPGLPDPGAAQPPPPSQPRSGPAAPRDRLRMIDELRASPDGGRAGLGLVVAKRAVDAADWYFRAHFMGDPVQPGSLGLEAMAQALAALAVEKGLADDLVAPRFESLAAGVPMTWKYRGQVVPEHRAITVEMEITEVRAEPAGALVVGEGSLRVDGKRIYHAKGLAVRLRGERRARVSPAAEPGPTRLFPVVGEDRAALLADLARLAGEARRTPFAELSRRRLSQHDPAARLACVIAAGDAAALEVELGRAEAGLPRALDQGEPWKTPAGSAFAARPLGPEAKIAFVYPGMGSAYPGAGRGLFRRHPALLDALLSIPGLEAGQAIARDLQGDVADAETFARDAVRVSSASMALSHALTRFARRELGLEPAFALGFSIGEGSMFAALGVFSDPAALEARLSRSEVFRRRLAGPMLAVREHHGLAPADPFTWGAAIVQAPADDARRALAGEPRAYLLTVHTPAEVMIGGDLDACHRVVAALGARAVFVPFQLAMHCDAALSDEAALAALHTLEVTPSPGIAFHSAAATAPVPQVAEEIAAHLARSYTRTVDFPALVRRVHDEGARVFVETGPQASCSRWIERTLQDRPHAAVPLSTRAFDDETSIARAVAVLLTHRVPVRLAPLLLDDLPGSTAAFAKAPAAAPPSPAAQAWEDVVAAEAARLLGWTDLAQIPADTALPIDSLAALELRARLERRARASIATELLFRHRTIRSLAAALAEIAAPQAEEALAPRDAGAASGASSPYRGSWGQADIWHMPRPIPARLPPAELHRTVPILWLRSTLGVRGPLDADALARAIRDTFAGHEILRSVTADPGDDGPPLVAVLPGWLPEVPVIDVAHLDPEAREAAREALLAGPIDPSRGPPARLGVLRVAADDHTICLLQHHIFTDGLSLMRFWQEVLTRYRAAAEGLTLALPPTGPTFERCCRAQDAWLLSEESAAARAYWTRTLEGATPILLPGAAPRREPTDFRGERIPFAVPAAVGRALGSRVEQEHAGMFAALLLALGRTLHAATGQDDLLITTYHAGRVIPGLADAAEVMGPLSQGLPLRLRLGPGGLADAQRTVMDALEHGAVPIEFLRRAMKLPLPASRMCLMYQAFAPPPAMTVGSLTVSRADPVGFGKGHASFDLELVLWPDGDTLRGLAAFAAQIYDRPAVERLLAAFLDELSALAGGSPALDRTM